MADEEQQESRAEGSRAEARADRAEARKAAEQEEEPTYHVDRLIGDAEGFFKVPGYVVVGALEMIPGNRKNFTLAETKQAIKDYNEHVVEIDHPFPEAEEG